MDPIFSRRARLDDTEFRAVRAEVELESWLENTWREQAYPEKQRPRITPVVAAVRANRGAPALSIDTPAAQYALGGRSMLHTLWGLVAGTLHSGSATISAPLASTATAPHVRAPADLLTRPPLDASDANEVPPAPSDALPQLLMNTHPSSSASSQHALGGRS